MSELTDEEVVLDRGDDVVPKAPEVVVPPADPVHDKLDPKPEDDPEAETAEEKEAREAAELEEKKKANIRIPKHRLDEVVTKSKAREQALLEEIDRLKGGAQAVDFNKGITDLRAKISDLTDKYEDALLDGKKVEAKAARKQLDLLRDELLETQTAVKSTAAQRAAVDEVTFNSQLASVEATYDVLNPENPKYDDDKAREVVRLMNALIAVKSPRAKALTEAVHYVMGPPPAFKGEDKSAEIAKQRAEAARRKAAEADKKQPANAADVGVNSDRLGGGAPQSADVMKMTQVQFSKLTEDNLARLRGDIV